MLNLPNILTLSRIALLPVIVGLFFVPEVWAAWAALGLYAVAAVTDFLDGVAARKLNQITAFGKFLDPIADKIFVAVLLVVLVGFGRLPGAWMIVPIIILVREFLVAGMREFLGPANIQLPVTNLAKWKTTVQMIATGFLIIGPALPYALSIGQWGLAVAAVLTVITGWGYMKVGMAHINNQNS